MADIHCQTCGEPWDTYHLRHDAVHETDLSEASIRSWVGRLDPGFRPAFERAGYRFGASIFSLRRCPCCPKDARRGREGRSRGELADTLSDLLGDDLDGLEAELTDIGI